MTNPTNNNKDTQKNICPVCGIPYEKEPYPHSSCHQMKINGTDPTNNNKEKCCEKCRCPSAGNMCPICQNKTCPCHTKQTPHQNEQTVEEQAIDHERYALLNALKSIVPPPYMLQVDDIEMLKQKGYTEATAHIENEKRTREYENTILQLEKYFHQAEKRGEQRGRERCIQKIKEISDSQEYQTYGEYVKCEDLVDDLLQALNDKE